MLSLRQRLASAMVLGLVSASMLVGVTGCASKAPAYIPIPSLDRVGLRKVWESQIALAPKEKITHIWRVGDSVYVTTTEARIVRLEAASGVRSWDVLVGDEGADYHRPVEINGGKQLLLADRGNFYVLNKDTGRVTASQRLEFVATSAPVVVGTTLCVGGNENFHGLYLDQLGGQRWVLYSPDDVFTATPAIIGDTLAIASRNGRLWRVNGSDGNWLWKDRKTNGEVTAPLAADARNLYVPSLDGYLYAFDVNTGGEMWDARLSGKLDQKPIPVKLAGNGGDEVLVPSTGKGLYAISPADGSVRWEADGVSQVASVNNGMIWAADSSGNLRSIRVENGDIVSSSPIPALDQVVSSPDQWVIVLNKAGVIDAFTPNP